MSFDWHFCRFEVSFTRMTNRQSGSPDATELPRIYLIRHGETAWSRSGQHTGRTDLPLTPEGEAEARTLAGRLAGIRFDQVYSSPRQRAQRTCELAGLAAAMFIDPDLAEWDYGDYEGLRTEEIRANQPDWSIYRDGCPQGESPADISARADRLIVRLAGMSGTTAVFSHGHFGRVLAVRWIGWPVPAAAHLLIHTASLSLLTCEQNRGRPVIGLWNSVA